MPARTKTENHAGRPAMVGVEQGSLRFHAGTATDAAPPVAEQLVTQPETMPVDTASCGSVVPHSESSRTELETRIEYYRSVLRRRARRLIPWSVLLFAATCASTFYVGGLQYAVGLMAVLVAHEFGHFLQALRHRVPVSPPLFLPLPVAPLGTMGAVILQGPGFANRRALFDIAVAGPLAGLAVALPMIWLGLESATVVDVVPGADALVLGEPLLLQWMIQLRFGELAASQQVNMTPLLFAGWVSLLITSLNLLPSGQLDGGHILYTLIGRHAHLVALLLVAGAVAWMALTQTPSYALFLLLLLASGTKHPPTADDSVPLGPLRTVLGWLTLAFVVVGFTPAPVATP